MAAKKKVNDESTAYEEMLFAHRHKLEGDCGPEAFKGGVPDDMALMDEAMLAGVSKVVDY